MVWTEVTAGKRGKPARDIGAYLATATAEGTPLQPEGVASKPSATLKKVQEYMTANRIKNVRVFIAQDDKSGLYSIIAQAV
jgi:hypothetical protein